MKHARGIGRIRQRARNLGLPALIVGWWLVVAIAMLLMIPAAAAAVPGTAQPMASGNLARVYLPGQVSAYPSFPIPVERAAFDEAQRGYRESDEALLEQVTTAYEWIAVTHGQVVEVIRRDGEAIEVRVLDGTHAGRRGWLKARHLAP